MNMELCGPTKPSSLPEHWPNPTRADIKRKPKRIITVGGEQEFSFCNNSIKTSKYEWYSFLPLLLLEEFHPREKPANLYFFIVGMLQIVPAISNTRGYPTIFIPLGFVLLMTGLLKGMEDLERHKADAKANASVTQRYNTNTKEFEEVTWSQLQVGEFVRVASGQGIPADIVLVQVAERNPAKPQGLCFVETKSLDGETNLKPRLVLPSLVGKIESNAQLAELRGAVQMEHPNNLIDSFSGVIQLEGEGLDNGPIMHGNVILRGCSLRGTEWVIGLVLNTGHDVKVMQSGQISKRKFSNVELIAGKEALGVLLLLLLICFAGATGQAVFDALKRKNTFTYLNSPDLDNAAGEWFVQFFYLLLLHASFIPVTLYVMMLMVRFIQAYFMKLDLDMYHEPMDTPAQVRTMNLNEELGQVSHIFSDKTGTLTCNNMNFRKASINGVPYGKGITEIGKAAWRLMGLRVPPEVLEAERLAAQNKVPHVAFYCPDYERDMQFAAKYQQGAEAPKGPEAAKFAKQMNQVKKIAEFWRFLAVCHEVVAEKLDNGKIKLSAPNPDDEALVCAAAYFGYEFKDRRDNSVSIFQSDRNQMVEIEILHIIPFSSDRKRMSVIIRDIDGKIRIVTKGADAVMLLRMAKGQDSLLATTQEDIDRFSLEGLRCLIVGAAEIETDKYLYWRHHYVAAQNNLTQLEKKKNGMSNDIDILENFIERNLIVVGATAIEDRLQDGVPECVERLQTAGIKIWVLTGDKEETAINIAVACNLVHPPEYMKQIIINQKTAPDIHQAIEIFKSELKELHQEYVDLTLPELSSHGHKGALARASSAISVASFYPQPGQNGHIMTGTNTAANLDAQLKPRALIIDGPSLLHITSDPNAKALMLLFSQRCKAVVCCRVSPDQKREVVDLVQQGVPGVRTLAIGDGANDVAMIKTADIGVGIKGEEGVQAVNASDYAIAQFRFLSPLLLKHGRSNYIRSCNLVLYIFYKNILMSMSMFWFNFLNGFSGQKYYSEASLQLFNLLYTSLPILFYAVYDRDVPYADVLKYPMLYKDSIQDKYLDKWIFWSWIWTAALESLILGILSLYLLTNSSYETGTLDSFWESGAVCFTTLVIVANNKIFMFQNDVNWFTVAAYLFGVLTWIAIGFIFNNSLIFDFEFYRVFLRVMRDGSSWLFMLLLVGMIGIKDLFYVAFKRHFMHQPVHVLQEIAKFGVKPQPSAYQQPPHSHSRATSFHTTGGESEGIGMVADDDDLFLERGISSNAAINALDGSDHNHQNGGGGGGGLNKAKSEAAGPPRDLASRNALAAKKRAAAAAAASRSSSIPAGLPSPISSPGSPGRTHDVHI